MARRRRSGSGGRWFAVVGVLVLVGGGAFATHALRTQVGQGTDAAPSVAPATIAPVTQATPAATTLASVAAPMPSVQPAPVAPDGAAREASWREARESTIRMQERLRAQQRARQDVEQGDTSQLRCEGGLRMRRVDNGWVQDGAC